MQLVLTEDQELLAKTAADFVAEKSPVIRVRQLRDGGDADGFSRELWKEMAELGWVGIPFAEEHGGADMGLAELAVVMEQLGRGLAPEPFLATTLLAGRAIALAGSEAQQAEWLPGVIEGDKLLAFAQQERRSRYDLFRVATKATSAGDGYTLSGEKIQVLDGSGADGLVVVARTAGDETDRDGIGLFLVRAGASGLGVERQHRVDSRGAALVTLDGTPAELLGAKGLGAKGLGAKGLGREGQGADLLEALVDGATVGLCAEMLGSMCEAFDRTLQYLKDREQFGVPIGSFQALKHRAAELFIEIELSRSCVMAAARAVDEGSADAAQLVSLAKARCSDAAVRVGNEAVQMHGGIGMTDEHEIGFFLKRARVAEMTFGDAAWHRERWARLNGY